MIFICYIVVFVALLLLYTVAMILKKEKQWYIIAGVNWVTIIWGLIMTFYYNSLPGYGKAPGLTYIQEFVSSCLFVVAQFCLFVVFLVIHIIKKKKSRDKE